MAGYGSPSPPDRGTHPGRKVGRFVSQTGPQQAAHRLEPGGPERAETRAIQRAQAMEHIGGSSPYSSRNAIFTAYR